jgi:hypothetical protein
MGQQRRGQPTLAGGAGLGRLAGAAAAGQHLVRARADLDLRGSECRGCLIPATAVADFTCSRRPRRRQGPPSSGRGWRATPKRGNGRRDSWSDSRGTGCERDEASCCRSEALRRPGRRRRAESERRAGAAPTRVASKERPPRPLPLVPFRARSRCSTTHSVCSASRQPREQRAARGRAAGRAGAQMACFIPRQGSPWWAPGPHLPCSGVVRGPWQRPRRPPATARM